MPDDIGVPTSRGLGIQVNGTGDVADHRHGGTASARATHRARSDTTAPAARSRGPNPETGLSFCYLTNGLDDNILRQKRRMLAIGSRAAALVTLHR